jgi:hypothetical protein
VGNSGAIAGDDFYIFKIDAEIVGADLSERCLLSLPLRRRAGEDINLAAGADLLEQRKRLVNVTWPVILELGGFQFNIRFFNLSGSGSPQLPA